jgi:hypothetical protein
MTLKRWSLMAAAVLVAAPLLVPRASRALKVLEQQRRLAALKEARAALAAGADGLPQLSNLVVESGTDDPDATDDAQVRALATAAEVGQRPGWAVQKMMEEAARARAKWDTLPAAPPGVTSRGTRTWTSLGPLAARSEYNGTYYRALDSGRLTAISRDPTNVNGIFIATSGGGIWYAPDANGSYPTWVPVTDTLGSLAVGAMAISPVVSGTVVTLYVGLGDVFDQKGGMIVKGTYDTATGAATWGTPIALATSAHPADGLPSAALDVRDVKVDPNDPNTILVSTSEGLYLSIDGGASYSVKDLPNTPAFGATREATWTIVYLGQDGGTSKSVWAVSGVYACPTVPGAKTGTSPPDRGEGTSACPLDATKWSAGDIWRSGDGGATWTSTRASGGFPAQVVSVQGMDPGRMELGAGAPTAGGATTTIYAEASASFEGSGPTTAPGCTGACGLSVLTAWYLKSVDGGLTWTKIASGLTGGRAGVTTATAVTNPTTLASDCLTTDAGHGQSWYNLAVAVDPQNPNRAIFGGNLCGIITVDGGATFQNGAHWLPQSGNGFTAHGFLPYVHADWHTALASVDPTGHTVLYVGTDGGFFVSRNIWDVANPEVGSWIQPDVGLATHLFYGIATGDPSLGNPNVLFGGLQDNGTRIRLVSDEAFIFEFNLGNWDQVVGGDGIGTAAATDTKGQNPVYWTSLPQTARRACFPKLRNCSQATRIENGVEQSNWVSFSLGVAEPFFVRYDMLDDDTSGVASASNTQANLFFASQFGNTASIRTVVPNNGVVVDGSVRTIRGTGLRVSPYRYTIDGVANSRLYGGVTTSGATGMGSFLVYDKPGVGSTLVNAAHGVSIPGVTGTGSGTMWIGNGSDWAAPQNPASLGGTDPKMTWLVSSNSILSNPVNCADPTAAACDPALFIPPAVGHLFKTTDGGNTWTAFHGNGTGFDLPNVPIWVIRYDPSDATDHTIWVGTDFGVYRTTDGGLTWAPFGTGLPAVRVWDIRIARNGSPVRVASYGRGVWEVFPNSEPPTAAGNGDFDRTQVVDFFDLASLAARMGSTPTTTGNLVYDSISDLDGSGTLDETDLGLLLAKFGSAP